MGKINKPVVNGVANRFYYKGSEYDVRQTAKGLQLYKDNRFYKNILISDSENISIDDIINDLENLKNGETIYQLFEYVGTGTSGQVTIPEEAAVFDLYGDGILDAIVVEADQYGSPTDVNSLNSNSEIVLVNSFGPDGTYSLDSTPVVDSCILYYIIVRDEDKSNVELTSIVGPGIKGYLPIYSNSTLDGSGSNVSPIGIAGLGELSTSEAGQVIAVNDDKDGFEYAGAIGTNPIQLKAISKLDQPIAIAPLTTVIDAEITQETNGITISNGVITFNKTGFFRIQAQLNFNNTNNTHLDTWAEYWDGDSWEILPDSGNHYVAANSDIGQFNIESTFSVNAGFQIRVVAQTTSGSASLDFISETNVDNPSVTFIAYEINPIVVGLAVEPNNLTEDLHIGNEANGNSTKIEPDGTIVSEGDATCWDDLSTSLIGRRLASNTGSVDYNWDENTITFQPNGSITNQNDRIVLNLQKPHAAKTDSVTKFHIHWEQPDATEREFTVRYRIQQNGELKNTTWTTVVVSTINNNVFPYTSGVLNQITRLVTIDWSTVPLSSTVQIQFTRTDSNAGNIELVFADSHVEYDMFGSRQEFIK